jgi:hypothetical protein
MRYEIVHVGRDAGHTYGKLNPWAVGSSELASESESNFETTEKRSSCDFALWKACSLNLFCLKSSQLCSYGCQKWVCDQCYCVLFAFRLYF